MKTACRLFAIICWLLAISGTGYGDPPMPPPSDSLAKTGEKQTSSNSPEVAQGKVAKPTPENQATQVADADQKKPNKANGYRNQKGHDAAHGEETAHPNSSPSSNAANSKQSQIATAPTVSIRPAITTAPIALSLQVERHLGPNPPVIGGPAKPLGGQAKVNAANTGINGTGLYHKH
jgi:hypothetical protein